MFSSEIILKAIVSLRITKTKQRNEKHLCFVQEHRFQTMLKTEDKFDSQGEINSEHKTLHLMYLHLNQIYE